MTKSNQNHKATHVIFFDVIETIFSLAPLKSKLLALKLPIGTDKLFFAQLLRDAFAISISGQFYNFSQVANKTLSVLLESLDHKIDEATLNEILAIFSQLPAHEDVRPALEKVKSTDIKIVLLTNGSRKNTEKLVHDNELSLLIDDIVSVEEFKIWKPHKALYQKAAQKYSCPQENTVLIAAHAWDVHGAIHAGLKGIWVQRQDCIYHPLMCNPNGQVTNLMDAVDLAIKLLEP